MGVACLEFRGENFRGWWKNREIRENFLPRKFPLYGIVYRSFLLLLALALIVCIDASCLLFSLNFIESLYQYISP